MHKRKLISKVAMFQEGPGVRNTQYHESGVKLLNVANLNDGKVDLSTSKRYISEEEAYGKYNHFLVDSGDLLIASSGITVETFDKKMGFAGEEHLPLCMNTSTIRFKTIDPKVLNLRYLMYFFKTDDFKAQLNRHITGTAQLNFGPSHLKKMDMPLPNYDEQTIIVDELDSINNSLVKINKKIDELNSIVKSQFNEMFGSIFDPKIAKKYKLGKYFDDSAPKIGGDYLFHEINYIDIGSVDNKNNIITAYSKYNIDTRPSRAQQIVKQGDVLISTVRPNLKNVAKVRDNARNLVASTGFCVLKTNQKVNMEFIFHLVKSEEFSNYLMGLISGASYPAVTNLDVLNFPYDNPNIELQNKFATFVEQVDKLKFNSLKTIDLWLLFKKMIEYYY